MFSLLPLLPDWHWCFPLRPHMSWYVPSSWDLWVTICLYNGIVIPEFLWSQVHIKEISIPTPKELGQREGRERNKESWLGNTLLQNNLEPEGNSGVDNLYCHSLSRFSTIFYSFCPLFSSVLNFSFLQQKWFIVTLKMHIRAFIRMQWCCISSQSPLSSHPYISSSLVSLLHSHPKSLYCTFPHVSHWDYN